MTSEEMKNIIISEVSFQELEGRKNKGIYEFFEQGKKSLGVSYEDIDDEKDVYIYNIFLGDQYVNISTRGTKENPFPEELLKFYVCYTNGMWSIDYTLKPVSRRTDMQHITGIKTDREMYAKVEEIINKIREQCGTINSNNNTASKWK